MGRRFDSRSVPRCTGEFRSLGPDALLFPYGSPSSSRASELLFERIRVSVDAFVLEQIFRIITAVGRGYLLREIVKEHRGTSWSRLSLAKVQGDNRYRG